MSSKLIIPSTHSNFKLQTHLTDLKACMYADCYHDLGSIFPSLIILNVNFQQLVKCSSYLVAKFLGLFMLMMTLSIDKFQ